LSKSSDGATSILLVKSSIEHVLGSTEEIASLELEIRFFALKAKAFPFDMKSFWIFKQKLLAK